MVEKKEGKEEGSLDLSLLSTGSIEWENFFFPSFPWLTRCPPFFCRLASILPQPDAPFPSSFPFFPGGEPFSLGCGWARVVLRFTPERRRKRGFPPSPPSYPPEASNWHTTEMERRENERTELRSGGRPTGRRTNLEPTLTAGSHRSA